MYMKTKVRKLWDFVKAPDVEEDDADIGTSLYAPTFHLFIVRAVLAIFLMVLELPRYGASHYSFHETRLCRPSQLPDVLYLFQSATFFVLSAASLAVASNFPVRT